MPSCPARDTHIAPEASRLSGVGGRVAWRHWGCVCVCWGHAAAGEGSHGEMVLRTKLRLSAMAFLSVQTLIVAFWQSCLVYFTLYNSAVALLNLADLLLYPTSRKALWSEVALFLHQETPGKSWRNVGLLSSILSNLWT